MANTNGTGPRRVAGPLITTQRIHHWIGQHPGCTREEVEAAALELNLVDRGYAHRTYAARLTDELKRQAKLSGNATPVAFPESPATIMATRSDYAVQWVTRRVLYRMCQINHSVACVDGRYTVIRPLKATGTLSQAQILSDPAHTSRELKRAEALRAFRLEWAQFTSPRGKLTWKARRAIIPWLLLELKMVADDALELPREQQHQEHDQQHGDHT